MDKLTKKTESKIIKSKEKKSTSPMMAQYHSIKSEYNSSLLFFRMGDFYELFFDDAKIASDALAITLTQRGKYNGHPVPMCGVPVNSAEGYIAKLIKSGFRVAICEQVEDPTEAKKRGSRAVVKRDVVRLITPGTITEEALLDSHVANYLTSIYKDEDDIAISWCDISTGNFFTTNITAEFIDSELTRIRPGEILISDDYYEEIQKSKILKDYLEIMNPQHETLFDHKKAQERICEVFNVSTIDSFGSFTKTELSAAGAIVEYLTITQKGQIPILSIPLNLDRASTMSIDASTRRSLELVESISGDSQSSLLHTIDFTVTGAGARALVERLNGPITDADEINNRLDSISWFVTNETATNSLRDIISNIADLQRALSRITVGRGGPRDLVSIRNGLSRIPEISSIFTDALLKPKTIPEEINRLLNDLGNHDDLVNTLSQALTTNPPMTAAEGNFVKSGYDNRLDKLIFLRDEGRKFISQLGERYKDQTGISSLKIKYNNILGYFVEVSTGNIGKLGDLFIHRQTLANSVRFTTTELSDLEREISAAIDSVHLYEMEIFNSLIENTINKAGKISKAANALAGLDLTSGLAVLASENNYIRPIVDNSLSFDIRGGRHPVVEVIGLNKNDFISNDCNLGRDEHLWLLTGPNMAGKSTFLRQNAIIAVLAQMGSFVPAEHAHIGIIDKLFSRVGAADDLARGRSTFMVEMIETAAILNQATEMSLVILDEIGRGTATYDGLSIAWATVEHLHEVNHCRGLFATHFHELTRLSDKLQYLSCYTMRVKEWKGDVIFLHSVDKGSADRSYGIHVAQLAGLPYAVIERAREVLELVEQGNTGNKITQLTHDLPLFSASQEVNKNKKENFEDLDKLRQMIIDLNPDDLTPRDALELIYKLKLVNDSEYS
tara:strand:- start:1876 stop:4572 length:2697 start_codon:yes stop_codon:yes gene_type:complete